MQISPFNPSGYICDENLFKFEWPKNYFNVFHPKLSTVNESTGCLDSIFT